MTPSEALLVRTLRSAVADRVRAGHPPATIRAELLAQVVRSLGKAYDSPGLAPLLPARVGLAARTLDGLMESAART